MNGAVFPPCCLSWGPIMLQVMKIMVTSFKRSHEHTAALSAPGPAAGHHWPTPLPETPGHSWASLGHSVGSLLLTVGSLLLTCGSWCVQGFVCAFQESVSPVLCKFWHLYGGPCGQGHCWPVPLQGTLKHSKAGLAQSLWGLLVPTGFVWSLWASLAGMGFDSKCNFVIISHYQ